MEQVRFGIVGLGNQGTHYNALIQDGKVPGGIVSAYCDIDPLRIDTMKGKSKFTDAAYFDDYDKMLDSGLIDAVLVETPHYLHPEMTIKALKRGLGVICDKPAGVYAKQVTEMIDFAKTVNAPFAMMFNQRTNCIYRKMREMIADGKIGSLQRVNWIITDWYRTQTYYDSGSWRATWNGEGGGVLFNQCPHQIDLVYWIIGELPKTVRGYCQYGRWHDIEVEDEVTAYFEYENGATGVFITTTGETPGTNRLEISGTKGKLLCENNKLFFYENAVDGIENIKTSTNGFARPEFTVTEVETDGLNEQHAGILKNFVNYMLGKEELFVAGTDGLASVELMDAIQFSGWTGETVTIPVDPDRYLAILNEKRANGRQKAHVSSAVADTAGTFGSGNNGGNK